MGVLDAWAYGIPCIMTPVGGIPDIVKDGEQGLLFPIGDSTKMAEALNKLIENKALRANIVNETDKYIIDDIIKNGQNGYVVNVDDEEGLTQAMKDAIKLKNCTMYYKPGTQKEISNLFD